MSEQNDYVKVPRKTLEKMSKTIDRMLNIVAGIKEVIEPNPKKEAS